MADVVTLVETVGSTIAAIGVVGGAAWRPAVRRHDQRVADDLFLHGSGARPGIAAVIPAGNRLASVEVGLTAANAKLDDHGRTLTQLAGDVKSIVKEVSTNSGGSLRDKVETIAVEVAPDDGHSLRDEIRSIMSEQTRVAEQHTEEREKPK